MVKASGDLSPEEVLHKNYKIIGDGVAEIRPEAIHDVAVAALGQKKWPKDEDRIDVVGQNGNTGEHYDTFEENVKRIQGESQQHVDETLSYLSGGKGESE